MHENVELFIESRCKLMRNTCALNCVDRLRTNTAKSKTPWLGRTERTMQKRLDRHTAVLPDNDLLPAMLNTPLRVKRHAYSAPTTHYQYLLPLVVGR